MKKVFLLIIIILLMLLSCTLVKNEELQPITYDENGVIMILYEGNYYYHPVLIANKALHNWNQNITGYNSEIINYDENYSLINIYSIDYLNDQEAISRFLAYADWFVNNIYMINQEACVWQYKFDHFAYLQKSPWVSSMAQSGGIRVLIRAYLLTGDYMYISVAQKAMKAYDMTIENSGVKQFDGDGNIYYEEYPGEPTSHVLNGFIFSLWGLYEHWKVANSAESYKLFEQGVQTLQNRIADYDVGDSSKYDLIRLGQVFRFVKNTNLSRSIPIDMLIFSADGQVLKATELDVGGDDIEGYTGNHTRINEADEEMWTNKGLLDGRTIRYIDINRGSICTINFLVPKNCNYPASYDLEIIYKDVFTGECSVQIYNGKTYVTIGDISGTNDGTWKTTHIGFNQENIRGREASDGYHKLHARQLYIMYILTDIVLFKEYSDLFYSYID